MEIRGSILVVEDEHNLGATLVEYLNGLGGKAYWADSAKQAQELFDSKNPQIVLMDIGLPDGDGLELGRKFREKRQDFVLLFLSALNDPDTKVEALNVGGHDYITKPFALKELTIRLENIFRYFKELFELPEELEIGGLKVWFSRYQVRTQAGEIIDLSQKEGAILKVLFQKKNQVVSREEIIEKVWGENAYPTSRTVDNYIVRLRKWADTSAQSAVEIQSVRGVGYALRTKEEN